MWTPLSKVWLGMTLNSDKLAQSFHRVYFKLSWFFVSFWIFRACPRKAVFLHGPGSKIILWSWKIFSISAHLPPVLERSLYPCGTRSQLLDLLLTFPKRVRLLVCHDTWLGQKLGFFSSFRLKIYGLLAIFRNGFSAQHCHVWLYVFSKSFIFSEIKKINLLSSVIYVF